MLTVIEQCLSGREKGRPGTSGLIHNALYAIAKQSKSLTAQKAEAGVLPASPSGGETAQRPACAGRRFRARAQARIAIAYAMSGTAVLPGVRVPASPVDGGGPDGSDDKTAFPPSSIAFRAARLR